MNDNTEKKVEFLIIVTGYNCKQYVQQCYNGIINQQYPDWKAIFISDGSTDGTDRLLTSIVNNPRCVVEIHPDNMGAAKRRYDAIKKHGNKLDVVILHGMDDTMFDFALYEIAMKYYESHWMTYGNWISQHGK